MDPRPAQTKATCLKSGSIISGDGVRPYVCNVRTYKTKQTDQRVNYFSSQCLGSCLGVDHLKTCSKVKLLTMFLIRTLILCFEGLLKLLTHRLQAEKVVIIFTQNKIKLQRYMGAEWVTKLAKLVDPPGPTVIGGHYF